jgi:D-alanyl-D-alanine carboxypeptidase
VARYLPGLLPDGDAITVRMILQHTSGLFDYTSIVPQDDAQIGANRFKHYDARQLVAAAAARPLLFPPGTRWSYSDTNYLVAGLLITAVTGRSWNSEVTGRIIRPLHLDGTSAPGDDPFISGPHADGYVMVGGTPTDITVWNPSVAGSAGAVISTAADLDRFLTALLGGVPGYSSFALSTLDGSRRAEAVITFPERPSTALDATLLEDAFCR